MKINLNFVLRKKSVSQGEILACEEHDKMKLLMGDVGCEPTGAKHPQEPKTHLCTWFNFLRHCEVLFLRHCEERCDAAIHKNSSNKYTHPGLPHSRWSFAMTLGFSLVELLMALLVASLLMAALAPVMTKKFGENVVVSGTGGAITPQGGCIFMEGSHQNVCKIPANTFAVGAIIASGGGGGGGAAKAAFGSVKYSDVINGVTIDAVSSNNVTLNKNTIDVTVQLVGGGGGGGFGSSNGGGYPKDQTDCGNWGVYVGPEYNGAGDTTLPNAAGTHPAISSGYHSICVSRRNPEIDGTNNAPKLNVSGVNYAPNTSTSCSGSGTNCCWAGQTSYSSDCNTFKNNMTYSACSRSVCQYDAANIICTSWKPTGITGRLPKKEEMEGWKRGIDDLASGGPGILNKPGGYNNNAGLEFCSRELGASMHCFYNSNCLNLGSLSPCNPDSTWAAEGSHGFMGGEKFTVGTSFKIGAALGVRCVIDRVSSFSPITGGGGGAGLYAEMKIPNDTIRKALSEGTVQITYTAGGGGKGAHVTSNSNYVKLNDTSKITSATNGVRSSAALTVNGVTKWEFSVPGGKAGQNASLNTAGTGGALINVSSDTSTDACYYKNAYSTNPDYAGGGYFKCAEINDGGLSPSLNAGTKGVNGGAGGNGYFAGSVKTGGGVNSTPSFGGGGGGGANATEGPTREYVTFNNAGDGGGGMARITYKLSRPGAGGGGGAAGTVVHLPNITTGIRPDTTFNVQVGAGGNGGIAGGADDGSNGSQGGTSSIEWQDGSISRYIRITGGNGGGRGIIGKPDDGIYGKDSAPGAAGVAGGMISISQGVAGKGDYFTYPSNVAKTAGKAVAIGSDYTVNYYAAPGGNGGINSKVSPADKKPCGGWSNVKIDYYGVKDIDEDSLECKLRNADDENDPYAGTFTPYMLSVTSDDVYRPDGGFKPGYALPFTKTNEAKFAGSIIGGATGGGGGAWKWPENASEQATAGANGMPGFVIIYWNLKEEGTP